MFVRNPSIYSFDSAKEGVVLVILGAITVQTTLTMNDGSNLKISGSVAQLLGENLIFVRIFVMLTFMVDTYR